MRRGPVVLTVCLVLLLALLAPGAATAADGDLKVSLGGPAKIPRVGETFEVTASVSNSGATAINDATLHFYVQESASFVSATSSDATDSCSQADPGSELTCALGTLGAGRTTSVTLTFTRTMAREIWIDAWLSYPSATEEAFVYDGIQIEPDRSNPADIRLQGSVSPDQPDPGSAFDYLLTVTNKGPETARDIKVRVYLPERATYQSAKTEAGSCELDEVVYEGEGHDGQDFVDRFVNCSLGSLGFAEQASITIGLTRAEPHEMWAYGYATTASFDQVSENDYVDLHTPGHPSVTSDLALSLAGPTGAPPVGSDLDYVLSVTNNGPVAAPDTRIGTYIPQGMELRSLSASDGVQCTRDEWGGVDCAVGTLQVGGHAVVTFALTRTHARENWVGGWTESPNYDPNYENNWVEVALAPDKTNPANVGITMSGPVEPAVGSTFDQVVTVTNHGPMTATNVTMVAYIPEGVDFVGVAAGEGDECALKEFSIEEEPGMEPYVYHEVHCTLGDMAPGETSTMTISMTRASENELWGSAGVNTSSYDEVWDNDWAEWSSTGKIPDGDCLEEPTTSGDDVRLIACDYATGGGADRVEYETSSKMRRSEITTGAGNDTLEISVPNGAKRERRVVVRTGRGNDRVAVVAPRGVTNAVVVIRTGGGRDTVSVEAVDPGRGFRVIVISGAGRDSLSGSAGRQKFWGGPGADHLDGGSGNDRLAGGLGRDRCLGGGGTDLLIGC